MTGPGNLAVENHDDLASRLAALVDSQGVAYMRRAVTAKSAPYGEPFRVDLLLAGLDSYPKGLGVVARWQEGSGSADQKLFYTVACIKRGITPTYIVLDGDGWREGVWAYWAEQVRGPFLGMITVDEFAELLSAARGIL